MLNINYLLMNIMVYIISRAALQILLQGIILKPLKMPVAKLYLLKGWSRGGAAHPIRAGAGDGSTYHQKVNNLLKNQKKYLKVILIKIGGLCL